jgi:hypothetical protein
MTITETPKDQIITGKFNNKKYMFHIFVIGSASSQFTPGQLPSTINILEFVNTHKDKLCYFYFIDPQHYNIQKDCDYFTQYTLNNINFSVITKPFNFKSFHNEYKVDTDDNALFVDYANYTGSEYDFVYNLGPNNNWYYSCPGCSGKMLDIMEVYSQAKTIPHYYSTMTTPINKNMSIAYKQKILGELHILISYVRFLPIEKTDPEPPEWLKVYSGNDKSTWTKKREISYNMLVNLFEINNVIVYNDTPMDKWYDLIKLQLLGL